MSVHLARDADGRVSLHFAPPPAVRYLANDADNEPTLWHHEHGKEPMPIMRRCELDQKWRDQIWPLIVEAVCGS